MGIESKIESKVFEGAVFSGAYLEFKNMPCIPKISLNYLLDFCQVHVDIGLSGEIRADTKNLQCPGSDIFDQRMGSLYTGTAAKIREAKLNLLSEKLTFTEDTECKRYIDSLVNQTISTDYFVRFATVRLEGCPDSKADFLRLKDDLRTNYTFMRESKNQLGDEIHLRNGMKLFFVGLGADDYIQMHMPLSFDCCEFERILDIIDKQDYISRRNPMCDIADHNMFGVYWGICLSLHQYSTIYSVFKDDIELVKATIIDKETS